MADMCNRDAFFFLPVMERMVLITPTTQREAVQTEHCRRCKEIQSLFNSGFDLRTLSAHQLQTLTYLSRNGRPDFQRVVVGAADDAVAAELEAGDHVVVVTFQNL